MAPETQAPAENLKHPGFFATAETGRSEPPMIVPWSNGEEGPKSRTKPTFLDSLFQVTVVPTFMQKGLFALAPAIPGVTEAALPARLMSTLQGAEADPHVVSALHICPGSCSEQTYLLLSFSFSFAPMEVATRTGDNRSKLHHIGKLR